MAETVLGGAVDFLQDFGFFDVVLPFLLVFTLVFGILEKTKIFGTEKVGDKEYPKKNINAMIAFVVAFFVITAKEIVASIRNALPMVSLILLAIICFLMLVGSFVATKEEFNFLTLFGEGWKLPITIVFILAIVGIFFQSFGWLNPIIDYISGRGQNVFIIFVFVGAVAGIIGWLFSSSGSDGGKKE